MKIKRYFRVKYGFQASDQVSIEEKDLDKAILAQVRGIPVQVGTSYVNGRNIISITPHWHKHTGWYDWYEPKDGEDWKQIERDCPPYDFVIEAHKNLVFSLIKSGREKMLEEASLPEEMVEKEILRISSSARTSSPLSVGEIIKK